MTMHALVGTSWRGASGGVATVERVEAGIAIGRWDSGNLWSEHCDLLDKMYTRAPALRADDQVEIERRDVTDDPTVRIPCRGCGATITLWFNGGELDRRECCGYEYETEAVRIDLVVSRRQA